MLNLHVGIGVFSTIDTPPSAPCQVTIAIELQSRVTHAVTALIPKTRPNWIQWRPAIAD